MLLLNIRQTELLKFSAFVLINDLCEWKELKEAILVYILNWGSVFLPIPKMIDLTLTATIKY